MDLSLESLPLLVIFLLPGFFWFYVRQHLSHSPGRDLTTFELTMFSLGYSVLIALSQGVLLFMIASLLQYKDVARLVLEPTTLFLTRPGVTTMLVLVWFLSGLTMAYLIGKYDPVERLLEKKMAGSERSGTDIWHRTFVATRAMYPMVDVVVHMTDGDVYTGHMCHYDQSPDKDGHREFAIAGVSYRPGVEGGGALPYDRAVFGERSVTLLNSRHVKAVDVLLCPETPRNQDEEDSETAGAERTEPAG